MVKMYVSPFTRVTNYFIL